MKLNEIIEQYKVVAKSANSRSQQRKLEALEYNLERLSTVQQQVRPLFFSPCGPDEQLVEQNLTMKKELSATERRLNARNDRIYQLEQLVTGQEHKLNQREQRYNEELQALKRQVSLGTSTSSSRSLFLSMEWSWRRLTYSTSSSTSHICSW